MRDTGIGIKPGKIKSLFNEFMYNTTFIYSEGEGAELGLNLSARLAKLIGAELKLEYTSESGSKFCLHCVNISQGL